MAREIYDDLLHRSSSQQGLAWLRDVSSLEHESSFKAATGGEPVSPEKLEDLRQSVQNLAEELGWPAQMSQEKARTFDSRLARLLNREMDIVPSDAGADGVWTFLSLVLLPEVPPWRWPTWNERRFLEHPRNTFRNAYWRGYVLGTERGGILDTVGEDELTAIIERPSLSTSPRLARAIYLAYLPYRAELGKHESEMFLMRDYAKRLRRLVSFVALDALQDDELDRLLKEAAEMSLGSLTVVP